MSKGSSRRPSFITDQEFAHNWDLAFPAARPSTLRRLRRHGKAPTPANTLPASSENVCVTDTLPTPSCESGHSGLLH